MWTAGFGLGTVDETKPLLKKRYFHNANEKRQKTNDKNLRKNISNEQQANTVSGVAWKKSSAGLNGEADTTGKERL